MKRIAGCYEQINEEHPDISELLFLGAPLRWALKVKSLEYCVPWVKYNIWVWFVSEELYPSYASKGYIAFTPDELLMLFGSTRGYNVQNELDKCYEAKVVNPWMIVTSLVPLEFGDFRCK